MSNNIIVSKFGGSITSTAEGLRGIADLIRKNPSRRYVIASAPGQIHGSTGITDMLYMCHSAFRNNENYNEILAKISDRYRSIIEGLGIKFKLDSVISSLKADLISGRSSDYFGSRGEYILDRIIAEYLGWPFIDAEGMIFFDSEGRLDQAKTFKAVHEKLSGIERAVIPGFYGTLPDGNIKTFPRGDGDSSGAIAARGIEADLFEKWSVDKKFFSADPSVVPDSKTIRNITYSEAVELNYIGIKIIKDSVIFMLRDAGIPLKICSFGGNEDDEMLISSEVPESISRNIAVCIAGRRNFKVIHIEKYGLNQMYGFGEKLFGLFGKHHIACEHCLSGIYKMSIVIKTPMFELRRNELINDIKKVIEPDSITIEKDLSLIAVIGQGIGPTRGTFERVFAALSSAGITVRMIDQGSDDLNIILGVHDEDYESAVRALYRDLIPYA